MASTSTFTTETLEVQIEEDGGVFGRLRRGRETSTTGRMDEGTAIIVEETGKKRSRSCHVVRSVHFLLVLRAHSHVVIGETERNGYRRGKFDFSL